MENKVVRHTSQQDQIAGRNQLIIANRKAALKIAIRLLQQWGAKLENSEVQSITDLALCEAARNFSSAHNAAFLTYSFLFIKGALIRNITVRSNDSERYRPLVHDAEGNIGQDVGALPGPEGESPEHNTWRRELRQKCHSALLKLSPLQRDIIIGNVVLEENMAVLARRHRLSRGHMFATRRTAMQQLHKDFEPLRLAA